MRNSDSFSDVGDSVLVSGGHRDQSLASAVLHHGRMAIILEPTASKRKDTEISLDKATGSAAKQGSMWARILKFKKPPVTVGPGTLPALVPESNIPLKHFNEVAEARKGGEEEQPERAVAVSKALDHGVMLSKVSL